MLSIVHTAETQFRHESSLRDREFAILAAIRERESGVAKERTATRPARRVLAWPRPIGAQHRLSFDAESCAAVA